MAYTHRNLSDILFTIDSMDAAQLDILGEAIRDRHKSIQNARRAAVRVGDFVTLANIRPKRMNGLRGEVIEIDSARKYGTLKTAYGTLHTGIPLATMVSD